MSTVNVITAIRIAVKRQRRKRQPLRLSTLLRYAIATAKPDPDGRPITLPEFIPSRCCFNLFRCENKRQWIVGDGRNHVYFCDKHHNDFWEAGNEIKDFSVERYKQPN